VAWQTQHSEKFHKFESFVLENTANWAQTKASPTKSHCQLEVGPAILAIHNNDPKPQTQPE